MSGYALIRSMLGDFDFESLRLANRFMGPLFFFVYTVVGVLIIFNLIIAIIADAYMDASELKTEKEAAFKASGEKSMPQMLVEVSVRQSSLASHQLGLTTVAHGPITRPKHLA